MAKILNAFQCERIKVLRRKFKPFADRGWMCEGSDWDGKPCNVLFNNDTDEMFFSDYAGNILSTGSADDTSISDMQLMATIQGAIMSV